MKTKLQAQMRLAYNRACVVFPKVDPDPIEQAIWQCYANVAYEIGSTFVLGAPILKEEVQRLTDTAVEGLLAKNEFRIAVSGMPPNEARKFGQVGMGLDQATAMHLFRYAQQYRKDFMGIKTRRATALESRRNNLANQMVQLAVEQAQVTLPQIDRGEVRGAEFDAR
jgi:hypothetical protein